MQVLIGTYDLVCFADCQGKHDCPDKRVYEGMPAVMRLVRGTTALQPNANSQQMDVKSVDRKRGHAMMQCNMQLLFYTGVLMLVLVLKYLILFLKFQ